MHQHSPNCSHCHSSVTPSKSKIRLLVTAIVLIVTFAGTEFAVGMFSHSLALVADSEHLVSDCLALGLALFATWMANRQTPEEAGMGNHRVEVVAALVNGIALVAIALWIGWEAIERLQAPSVEILSLPMLATASVGFGVNSVNIFLLHKDSHSDLNLKGVVLHLVADAISSIGVIIAAIAVWAMNWIWADGVISLFVSGLIIVSSIPLLIQSVHALFPHKTQSILG